MTAKVLFVHRYPWKRQFFRSEKPRRYLQFGIHGIRFIPAMKCKFKERKDLICSPNLHNTQVRSSVKKPFGQDISLPAIGKAGFSLLPSTPPRSNGLSCCCCCCCCCYCCVQLDKETKRVGAKKGGNVFFSLSHKNYFYGRELFPPMQFYGPGP